MKQEIIDYVNQYKKIFCDISDRIFENPETKYQEYYAAEELAGALKEMGYEVMLGIGGIETAFLARFHVGDRVGGKGNGPCIALLAEYDALPGFNQSPGVFQQQTYANWNETQNGHGCGHNLLGCGSALAFVATARYLKEHQIDGEIRLYGCPAEEGGAGKSRLVAAGCFEGVDYAFTWHPADYNCITSGSSLANAQIRFSFFGKSAHAAIAPHMGRSALDAVELMNVGCNYLREHIIPEARMHYAYQNAGGVLPGAVPAEAEILYQIRAPRIEDVEDIAKRVIKVAQGAALMTETTMSHTYITRVANIKPDHELEKHLYSCMEEIPLPQYSEEEKEYAKRLVAHNEGNSLKNLLAPCARLYGTDTDIRQHMDEELYNFLVPYLPDDEVHFYSSDVGDVSQACPTAQFAGLTWVANTFEHTWIATSQGKSEIAHKGMAYAACVLALASCKKFKKTY